MKLLKLLRDRRGISMTEVVIAMTMVTLITGAAISVVAASARADVRFEDKSLALTACENASECVRFADDKTTLAEALENAGFGESEQSDGGYTFTFTSGSDTVAVSVITQEDKIENCVVKYNDDEIYEIKK